MVRSRINTLSLLKKEETSKINLSTGQEILIHISSKSCPAHLWSLLSERVLGCKFSLANYFTRGSVCFHATLSIRPTLSFIFYFLQQSGDCDGERELSWAATASEFWSASVVKGFGWSRGSSSKPTAGQHLSALHGRFDAETILSKSPSLQSKDGVLGFMPTPRRKQWVSDSRSVTSDSLRSHGPWPDRPLCPWDSPGENTGVCCHFLLQAQKRTPEETSRPRGCTADQRLMPPGQETLLWPETRAQGSENLRQQHAWRVLFCVHPIQPPELFSSPSNHPNLSRPRPPRSLLRLLPYAPLSNSQTSYPATEHICTPCLCFFA